MRLHPRRYQTKPAALTPVLCKCLQYLAPTVVGPLLCAWCLLSHLLLRPVPHTDRALRSHHAARNPCMVSERPQGYTQLRDLSYWVPGVSAFCCLLVQWVCSASGCAATVKATDNLRVIIDIALSWLCILLEFVTMPVSVSRMGVPACTTPTTQRCKAPRSCS
jgi:hypothetical protein